jgi:mannobiose 2-epimerase
MDTTSYGHNLELAWLLHRAAEPLGESPSMFHAATRRLAEHALEFGLDREYGGVYRDGPHTGPALVRDKEWWQNSEALVGWLDAYEQFADPRFAEAFLGNWEFDRKFFIHPQLGEWRQLLSRDGAVIVGDLGNPWKACYHSGRSVLECIERLDRLLAR